MFQNLRNYMYVFDFDISHSPKLLIFSPCDILNVILYSATDKL